jgi:hypothetical protein
MFSRADDVIAGSMSCASVDAAPEGLSKASGAAARCPREGNRSAVRTGLSRRKYNDNEYDDHIFLEAF